MGLIAPGERPRIVPLAGGVSSLIFKVEVEADSWEEAKKQIWHCELDGVYDTQWDLYDLEEVKEIEND